MEGLSTCSPKILLHPCHFVVFSAARPAVLHKETMLKLCGKPCLSSVNKQCVKRLLQAAVDKVLFHTQGVNRGSTACTAAEHSVSSGCNLRHIGVSEFYPQICAAYL
ncbi:hypothetical protein PSEUDO9AG_70283 [Pseudomonas sp. 9Ag]|nr:hypothetical protein PSEUDO9AG_70283 [Pseudomonas sp. 9Ag]